MTTSPETYMYLTTFQPPLHNSFDRNKYNLSFLRGLVKSFPWETLEVDFRNLKKHCKTNQYSCLRGTELCTLTSSSFLSLGNNLFEICINQSLEPRKDIWEEHEKGDSTGVVRICKKLISCFNTCTCLFKTALYFYCGLPVLVNYGYLCLILFLEVAENFLLQCHQVDTLLPWKLGVVSQRVQLHPARGQLLPHV